MWAGWGRETKSFDARNSGFGRLWLEIFDKNKVKHYASKLPFL